jgi:hypothetical protein
MEQKINEIDLVQLFIRLYHCFIRRYKLLGIFVLIGFLYGIYTYFTNKDQYESKIVAASYIVPAPIIIDLINSLNDINSQDKELTGKILNISHDEVIKLISFKADTIKTFYAQEGKTTIESYTTIEINIKGLKSLNMESVYKGLVNYINTNEYVHKELENERQRSEQIMNECEQQIKKLDSLQKNILRSSLTTINPNTVNSIKLNDKAYNFFHIDIIDLEKVKYIEQKRLNQMTGLYTINENNWFKSKLNILYKIVLINMLIFFGLGIFISLILEFRRFVKAAEKSR